MEFDAIVNNDQVGEETVTDTDSEVREDPKSWDESKFEPQYTQDDLDSLRALPVFAKAEGFARQGQFTTALSALERMKGERAIRARLILDYYVFSKAEAQAQQGQFTGAKNVIERVASSEEVAYNMRRALDKIVFKKAYEQAHSGQMTSAESTIVRNVSSKARAEAMLEELGLA